MEKIQVNKTIFSLNEIKSALKKINPIKAVEEGFIAYSKGKTVVPPVGELIFKDPPGDVHIKYGYILNDDYYVIKIASGFYENVKINLPSTSGLILLFKQKTGELAGILLDEGYLTNVRTAAAGAVVAKYMAPDQVNRIGVLGAGIQARLQVEYLKSLVDCKNIMVWGLDQTECDLYKQNMESKGYSVQTTISSGDVALNCNLIITATPSQKPLLFSDHIQPGTHITAVGSDTPEKQELDPRILQQADIVVGDSHQQCKHRGEIHQAVKAGLLKIKDTVELGQVILDKSLRRKTDNQITVADLTGVAVQDIQISKAIVKKLLSS